MKENYTELYPNKEVAQRVGDYAFQHSTKLPQHITNFHAWGSENHEMAKYMISPLQAQFQVWVAQALGAKRILEIGCFIGFSALGWAKAVGVDGHVTTLELDAGYASIARDEFVKNEIKNVEVIVGDAKATIRELVSTITEPYDLIFIDADKSSYPDYLTEIMSLSTPSANKRILKSGGIIMADNILGHALVADSSEANPWTNIVRSRGEDLWKEVQRDKEGLDKFNKMLVENKRVTTFLMPMFDGLGLGRLLD
ncbi:O-methyltransferase-like protein [Xylogone sp. PMI_703]|nr:O-methyltransferase-like protein [Xylogone sp. PMI_703]